MIKTSFTTEPFDGKVNPSLFEFECLDVSPLEFLTKVRNGYNYCGLFKDESGKILDEFYIKEKTKANFLGTNVVTIDIDDVEPNEYPTIESYLKRIGDLKPSIIYPTYHHNKEKKGNDICIRVHLVYLFNETLTDIDYYNVVSRIKKDLPTPTDEKAEQHVQFFYGCYNFTEGYIFGSDKDNIKVWSITELNKDFTDFDTFEPLDYHKVLPVVVETPITEEYIKRVSEYCKLENKFSKGKYEGYKLNIPMLYDMENSINIKDLYRIYGRTYKSVYRVENGTWVKFKGSNLKLQEVDKSYFKINWLPKEMIINDGELGGRRRYSYNRLCMLKLLKPKIELNELIFNYYVFVEQHINNSDRVFTLEKIIDESIRVFVSSISSLKNNYSKLEDSFRNNEKLQCKSGVIASRGSRPKEVLKNWRKIVLTRTYNPNKTDKENYNLFIEELKQCKGLSNTIREQLIRTSFRTYMNYKKELLHNNDIINLKSSEDEEIIRLLDFSVSSRENLKMLQINGYKIGINRVQRLLKKHA